MTRTRILIIGCLLIASAIVDPVGAAPKAGRDDVSLTIFMRADKRSGAAYVAPIAGLSALPVEGDKIPLKLSQPQLDSAALAGKQIPLASGSVKPGTYRGLRITFGPFPASEGEATETVEPIELLVEFRVEPPESITLIVDVDLAEIAGANGRPSPTAFGLRRASNRVVRRLTLYVSDREGNRVIAINRNSKQAFATIAVGHGPRGLHVERTGRVAYVANGGDDTVSVLDPAQHKVIDTLSLRPGCAPEDVTTADDDRILVVSCPGPNMLAVIDPRTNANIGEVELPRAPTRVTTSRDGRTVYALLPESHQVAVIDATRPNVAPRLASVDAEPTDLVSDPRSDTLFVSHATAPQISVIGADLRRQPSLQVGAFSYGVVLERDGRRLYASGGEAGGVAMIGPQVGTVIRRWIVPSSYFMAIDPDGRKIYATSGRRGSLLVLDKIAGQLESEIRLGGDLIDVVVIP